MKRFREYPLHMHSKRANENKLITPADVLEKIAATNHLAVTEVVRLFLVQALPEPEWKLGTLEVSPARQRRFTYKAGNVIETHEEAGDFKEP